MKTCHSENQPGLCKVETGATEPLQSGGALMLGADQDCYAGCTDSTQAYHGLMDEVHNIHCFPITTSVGTALRPACVSNSRTWCIERFIV